MVFVKGVQTLRVLSAVGFNLEICYIFTIKNSFNPIKFKITRSILISGKSSL
jgi:hypothetical protein